MLAIGYNINYNIFQNDGEINSFEVHVLNNDNGQITNMWALIKPPTVEWSVGRVEISSNGEKEYQVGVRENKSI